MLAAIDQNGKKRIAYLEDEETLRNLYEKELLVCPECGTAVTLAAGSRRIHHFRHRSHVTCSYDSEPESAEHIKGKLFIYEWLTKRFPEAVVELEYKIKETNQRADVMAFFPSGERIAFEMQCTAITGEAWQERSDRYDSAGIENVWILSNRMHKYGQTDGLPDELKHKLLDLPLTIFKKRKWVLLLDTDSQEILSFYRFIDDEWHSPTILYSEESRFPLTQLSPFEDFWASHEIHFLYQKWKKERKREAKRLWKLRKQQHERKRRDEFAKAKRLQQERKEATSYQQELRSFNLEQLKMNMTPPEQNTFDLLIRKYKLHEKNFPGICKVHVPFRESIQTPYSLWQLWIYDHFIHKSIPGKTKLLVSAVSEKVQEYFRVDWTKENHGLRAIHHYIQALEKACLLGQVSQYDEEHYYVRSKQFPQMQSLKEQSYLAYYLSIHSNELLPKKVWEEVETTWTAYLEEVQPVNLEKVLKYPVIFKEYQQLEDMMTLYRVKKRILNTWEADFIEDFHNRVYISQDISNLQYNHYTKIKAKIEKAFEVFIN